MGVDFVIFIIDWWWMYKYSFDELFKKIVEFYVLYYVSCVVLVNGMVWDILRMVVESMDMVFSDVFVLVIVVNNSVSLLDIEGVEIL